MYYSKLDIINILKENSPIAVCDGTSISRVFFFENCFLSWLTFNGLIAKVEDNLYKREDFNLSKYKTIAFNTQGEKSTQSSFEKVAKSLSRENLKVIVVGSDKAYFRIKDMAKILKVKLIGFDYYIPMKQYARMLEAVREADTNVSVTMDDVWEEDDDLELMFFDPEKKWD